MMKLEPLVAVGVLASTALTDAVYVLFNAAVCATPSTPSRNVEQHLVSAVGICRHQLYAQCGLCDLRRGRVMDRRVLRDDVAAPWTRRVLNAATGRDSSRPMKAATRYARGKKTIFTPFP